MTKTKKSRIRQQYRIATRLNGATIAMIFFSGVSPSVFAQPTSATAKAATLEEVVVTARRRSEMASDVPLAITAITTEKLEEQGITEVTDLGRNVPGLNISSAGASTSAPLISLRGQRPSEILLTLDPAVPLYFADVVLTPTYGTNLSMYDLADVQVLKGPQGTLFGRNSTGGSILMTPKGPTKELEGYVKGTLGNYNLYRAEGAISLPVNDVLGFRLAGQKTERDGYQSNVANNSAACSDCLWDENSSGVRFITDIDSGDFRNLTTLSYDQDHSTTRSGIPVAFNPQAQVGALINAVWNGGLAAAGGPSQPLLDQALARQANRSPFDVEATFIPKQTVRNVFAANTTEFDLTDSYTIKNIFGYRKLAYAEQQDIDGTALPILGSITTDTPTVPDDVSLPSARKIESEQFSNELQLIGLSFDDKLEWIAGLYWSKLEGSENYLTTLVGANPNWPTSAPPIPQVAVPWLAAQNGMYRSSSEGSVLNESYAVFGEGVYDINDEFSVTVGLRQTWDKREMTLHSRGTSSPALPPQCSLTGDNGSPLPNSACSRTVNETFDSPTGRVALNYSPSHAHLLYGSISTGYRTGGFNLRGTNNATLESFDPEKVVTYEVGHKADWDIAILGNVRTAAALYWQDYNDIQKTQGAIIDGTFQTTTINAAKAVIRGVEFDVTAAPTDHLLFSLSYSYVDAYYKEWNRPLSTTVNLDNKHSPFVYIPESSVNASARYSLPLDPAIGEISLLASVYWQSTMDTHAEPQHFASFGYSPQMLQIAKDNQQADAYDIWNFRVSWQGMLGSQFDTAIFINNAFDEEYIVGGSNILDSLGTITNVYGEPRTFGASAQWNF